MYLYFLVSISEYKGLKRDIRGGIFGIGVNGYVRKTIIMWYTSNLIAFFWILCITEYFCVIKNSVFLRNVLF